MHTRTRAHAHTHADTHTCARTPRPPPQLLRVEHPAAKYTKVHGGAVETEADPAKLRFFDRERGEPENQGRRLAPAPRPHRSCLLLGRQRLDQN